jgi:putative flavoprotein involved in K+ transport
MSGTRRTERYETIVIGGGQAGLAAGYHLSRRRLPFVILEAGDRIGDVWRRRWDSLRLFTPARYNGLPGMRFPAPPHSFPPKDEFADFLESYARAFNLPVRTGIKVDALTKEGDHFVATAGGRRFEAENVVVAMGSYQEPRVPDFAAKLDPAIVQLHSAHYRSPDQLRPGGVLLVGAGNSGSEIAMELAPSHPVWMSGRSTGELPFRPRSLPGRLLLVPLVLRVLFYRILTVDTPIGRAARGKALVGGGPLIRVKSRDLAAAGVERVPRTAGVRHGQPVLEDGRVLDVANVIWCTGFRTGFESWIHLPVHGEHEPKHKRGIAADQPGLYFLGLHFQRALSSGMIHGVGRDAEEIVRDIAARASTRPAGVASGVVQSVGAAASPAASSRTTLTNASTSRSPVRQLMMVGRKATRPR